MQTSTRHYRDSPNLVASTQVFFARRDDDAPGLHLIRISRERWQPHFSIPAGRSRSLGILLVCDGRGHFGSADGERPIARDSLIIADVAAPVQIRNDPRHSLEFLMVYFGGRDAGALLASELDPPTPLLHPRRPHAVRRCFEHCFAAAVESGPEAESICLGLVRVLLRTVRNGLGPDKDHGAQRRDGFFACKALIDTRFRELTRVEDVARLAGISRAWLDRLFRMELGTTPRDYLSGIRLHYAAHRLQAADESVRAIAEELGYADQYAFSRAFKRRFGRAPSHYRQDAR